VRSVANSAQFARGPVLGLHGDLASGTVCLRGVVGLRLTHSRA